MPCPGASGGTVTRSGSGQAGEAEDFLSDLSDEGRVRPRISIRFIRRWAREAGDFYQIYPTRARVMRRPPLRQWGSFLALLYFALVIVPPSAGPLGGPGVLGPRPSPIEGHSSTVVPKAQMRLYFSTTM